MLPTDLSSRLLLSQSVPSSVANFDGLEGAPRTACEEPLLIARDHRIDDEMIVDLPLLGDVQLRLQPGAQFADALGG